MNHVGFILSICFDGHGRSSLRLSATKSNLHLVASGTTLGGLALMNMERQFTEACTGGSNFCGCM